MAQRAGQIYYQMVAAFIDAQSSVNDLDTLSALFITAIKKLGFTHYTCMSFCNLDAPPPDAVLMLHYPTDWADYYREQRYERFDRIIDLSLRTLTPFSWDQPFVTNGATKQQMDIFHEASQIGLSHGISIPIHAGDGLPATVTMVGPNSDIDPDAWTALHMMSLYLHEAAQRLINKTNQGLPAMRTTLTPRERECLQWASEGKSDTVIADILRLAPRTVHFHIENVKGKYGVASRTQAVVRALAENQIIPQ